MAKEAELSIFELMRDWFDFCYENPHLVNPNHSAMYFFILSHCNRLGWKPVFGLPKQMTMDAIGIKNYRTYKKTFEDIVNWGFVNLLQKSENQYSANVVGLVKNTISTTKSLSKATQYHSQNHSQKHCNIIAPILIPNTIIPNTNIERENIPPENSFDVFKNRMELEISDCFESVISNLSYLETISMNYHFPNIEITKQWIELFYKKLQNEGTTEKSVNDFKSHFARWLNIEIKNKNGNKKSVGLSTEEEQREFLNAVASGIARANYENSVTV